MSSKNTLKLVLTLVVIIVFLVGMYIFSQTSKLTGPGEFELIIATEDEEVLFQQELSFEAGDTLYDVLKQHFVITCASKTYEPDPTCSSSFRFFANGSTVDGKIILGIKGNDFEIITDWNKTYLAIQVYENNRFRLTSKGVSLYTLSDGEVIRIIVTRVSGW